MNVSSITIGSSVNDFNIVRSFYSAMLCIRGTSHGPVSVCPSVTSRCSIETAERIELVFWHVSFLPPVLQGLHHVKRKFDYLQK